MQSKVLLKSMVHVILIHSLGQQVQNDFVGFHEMLPSRRLSHGSHCFQQSWMAHRRWYGLVRQTRPAFGFFHMNTADVRSVSTISPNFLNSTAFDTSGYQQGPGSRGALVGALFKSDAHEVSTFASLPPREDVWCWMTVKDSIIA